MPVRMDYYAAPFIKARGDHKSVGTAKNRLLDNYL